MINSIEYNSELRLFADKDPELGNDSMTPDYSKVKLDKDGLPKVIQTSDKVAMLSYASSAIANRLIIHGLQSSGMKRQNNDTDIKLIKLLKDQCTKLGIKVYEKESLGNSFSCNIDKEFITDRGDSEAITYEIEKQAGTRLPSMAEDMYKSAQSGSDHQSIIFDKDYDPSVLAHEMGHSDNYTNRDKNFVNKLLKLSRDLCVGMTKEKALKLKSIGSLIFIGILICGFYLGRRYYRSLYKTGKVSNWYSIRYFIGLIVNLPILIEEGRASYKGLKILHQSGLPKSDVLSKGFKKLLPAFGSYLTMGYCSGLIFYSGFIIGKLIEKSHIKSKLNEKSII